ncbi:MAG: helix-turn-helix domain-containing protein [Euzebya sp.]
MAQSTVSTWRLVRDARRVAGLSQRELADRAGTSQPAIARYEAGTVTPDLDTLARILHACGHRLQIHSVVVDPVDARQLAESISMTPARRSARNRRVTALAAAAARARREGKVRSLRQET